MLELISKTEAQSDRNLQIKHTRKYIDLIWKCGQSEQTQIERKQPHWQEHDAPPNNHSTLFYSPCAKHYVPSKHCIQNHIHLEGGFSAGQFKNKK